MPRSNPNFGDEYEALMPVGYAEGDDFFNESSWSGADAQPEETVEPEDNFTLESLLSETPADTADEAPTTSETEATPAINKLKFRAKVDHEDRDVELDENELPNIYQKAQVTDRVQEKLNKLTPQLERAKRLAKQLGYESVDEMFEATDRSYRESEMARLTEGGASPDVAEAVFEWKMEKLNREHPAEETVETPAPAQAKEEERDFRAEVVELLKAAPELRGKSVPNEVVTAAVAENIPVLQAYNNWKQKQSEAETEKLRKENNVLKQNADAAARAPVRHTTRGGATDTKDDNDPFLRGFNSGY